MARQSKSPAVVAELGRPETADEEAARRAENSRLYRARKTVNNLIYSLLATLGVVAIVYFAVPRADIAPNWEINYQQVAADSTSAVEGPLITPALDASWRANIAELTRIDGRAAWKVNFITPSNGFITFEQIFAGDDAGLARIMENRAQTGTLELGANQWWTEFDKNYGGDSSTVSDYALATFGINDLFILRGSATKAEFATVATAVAAAIGKVTP